jgi:hypothetical protein
MLTIHHLLEYRFNGLRGDLMLLIPMLQEARVIFLRIQSSCFDLGTILTAGPALTRDG